MESLVWGIISETVNSLWAAGFGFLAFLMLRLLPSSSLQGEAAACRGRSSAGNAASCWQVTFVTGLGAALPRGIKKAVMWHVLWTMGDSDLGAGIRFRSVTPHWWKPHQQIPDQIPEHRCDRLQGSQVNMLNERIKWSLVAVICKIPPKFSFWAPSGWEWATPEDASEDVGAQVTSHRWDPGSVIPGHQTIPAGVLLCSPHLCCRGRRNRTQICLQAAVPQHRTRLRRCCSL